MIRTTRRRLLVSSGAALATAATIRSAIAGQSVNDTLRFALIGCGGQGLCDAERMLQAGGRTVALVAMADPDKSQLDTTIGYLGKYETGRIDQYTHYGNIIDRKDIDFVIVATPDHWHAIPTLLACQAGKDVYVEKPCSHNIAEGRTMVAAARKYRRIVQVGQQQRSDAHFREVVDLLRKERPLGPIVRTETMNYENESPDGIGNPPDHDHAPPGADYDLWLGPAPKRNFNPNRFHGTFRWFLDYAAGMIGDWNVHLHDIVHWAMDVDAPTSVYAAGHKRVLNDNRESPDVMDVIYEYPGFTQVYTMSKAYARGGHAHNYGIEFFGTEASLFIKRSGWELIPEPIQRYEEDPNQPGRISKADRHVTEPRKGPGSSGNAQHQVNFLECLRSRRHEDLHCDIEVGHRTATACHLGNISMRVGREVLWDRAREIILHPDGRPDTEANVHLTREYRKGYELPVV